MRRKRPDLVLMDIGMPVMDGWQASRIIKADPSLSDVPLIAFSGRVDCVADLQARSNFDGFIRKPISPAGVRATGGRLHRARQQFPAAHEINGIGHH